MTTDHDEEACPACEGEDVAHDCGWINEDCPEQCETEHSVEREYVVECAQTGNHYRYCDRCGWEDVSTWADEPMRVNGEWLCDPCEHGYTYCSECGDLVDEDAAHYDDYGAYCSGCHTPTGNEPGEHLGRCFHCNSNCIHLDTLSEDFLCDHRAVERHMQGVPVEFIGTDIALKVLSGLSALGRAA